MQVTLLTHGLREIAGEVHGVDDRAIDFLRRDLPLGVPIDVQRAGAMAALAADGGFLDFDAVEAVVDRVGAADVAEQAARADSALKAHVIRPVIAGRHVPGVAAAIPGDR
ncbi:MAG: hypothetical protein U0793_08985 [Gemmataceae bacterium]